MATGRAGPRPVVAVAVVGAYLLAAVLLVAAALRGPAAGIFRNDVPGRFWPIARLDAPWVEEAVEFPPLSVAVLEPLAWVPQEASTGAHLVVQTLLLLAIVAVLWWGEGWAHVRRWMLWSLPLLPLVLLRVDLPSVLACVVALVLVRRGRDRAAGAAVALGVLAKLWPGVLVIGLWREHRDAVVVAVATSAAAVAAWMLVTVPDAPLQVIGFRDARGWHAESVVGSLVRLVDGGTPVLESDAWRFGDASVVPTVVLGLVAVALACVVAAHVEDPARVLLTTLALGLVAAPLFSPQYAVWLLAPLVFVDDLRREETWAVATVVVGSVAVVWWLGDVVSGTALGWTVLLVRNAGVVALAALLVRTGLARGAGRGALQASGGPVADPGGPRP